jgi:hypothetical protein
MSVQAKRSQQRKLYPGATERADFWAWAAEWTYSDRVWLELALWLSSTPSTP